MRRAFGSAVATVSACALAGSELSSNLARTAWKGYMLRATNTINYSTSLPLAQGVQFEL
jgi:hypothetical protein